MQFRVIVVTDTTARTPATNTQTHRQDRLQYTVPLASAQCKYVFFLAFLARDAMRKRGVCCRLVSVRPSVTLLCCIQTAKDIVKLLSQPSSAIFLAFTPRVNTQFQGEPIQQGRKVHGGREICDFWLKSPFISETVRNTSVVTMER